jgi:hypothetical protein
VRLALVQQGRLVGRALEGHEATEPKVAELEAAVVVDVYIRGLQVAVGDSVRVAKGKRV